MLFVAAQAALVVTWLSPVHVDANGAGVATRGSVKSLAEAAELRDSRAIDAMLRGKADVNGKQADGMTALLWAAHHDDLALARRLIAAGADVHAANRYGVTALYLACLNGNAEFARLLLEKGADANTELRGGETVLMAASRTGRVGVVKALLKHGAKVNAKERGGQTAIMWAAADGHAEVVEALIEAKADFRSPLRSGFTPLLFAARNGHIAVTRTLIKAGVDVNRAMSEARGGRNKPDRNTSPLLMAMENGHFELGAVLLEAGADPNDMRSGFAPLHVMSWVRKPPIGDNDLGAPPPKVRGKLTSLQFVRKLVEHGAKVDLPKARNGGRRKRINIKGTTPLLCAAATADVAYMKTLLSLGADPKRTNAVGHTALMLAAGIGESPEADGAGRPDEHYAAVAFLLEVGQDVNATCNNGETAMHGAAYRMLPKVVELLDKHGADIKVWARKSKQGRTPLSIAQGFRPGNFKPSHETMAAIRKVMLAHGVTPPPPPTRRDASWRN